MYGSWLYDGQTLCWRKRLFLSLHTAHIDTHAISLLISPDAMQHASQQRANLISPHKT